jgi:predicted dehydrogenase/threonine dehydrogenase-like Zn-dependent dehydrogenase
MKQVIQNFKSGELSVGDVPPPALKSGGVLVRTSRSLISAGTERGTVSVGQSSLVGKARKRPDLVRQVIDNVRREGVAATVAKVRTRLESLKPLGYSASGVVVAVGEGVSDLHVGDRVACAGANYASHAEVIFVPRNLCTPIPKGASLDDAAYTTLGAIAMQGVRQADVRLGETVLVIGLGLIGQLTAQLVRASGCRVAGVDVDADMVALAESLGTDLALRRSDDVERKVDAFTGGAGADAVIITASANSNDPVELAGRVARDRARVVIVGLVPVDVPRSPYFEKELDVRMSRSYGPGRYDPEYEERGHDYPIAYVRWTEGRNMSSFLELVASGRIRLDALTTHRFPLDRAVEAYDVVLGKTGERPCGILLEYGDDAPLEERIDRKPGSSSARSDGKVGVAFVGAGNFATASLLPPLKRSSSVELTGVATSSGLTAKGVADKFDFAFTASGLEQIVDDSSTSCVFVATRHNLHHSLAARALAAGRAVFVEKPLAVDRAGLREVVDAARGSKGQLMVGFNRRFAPLATKLFAAFEKRSGPAVVHFRVNAGFVPKTHWTQDPVEGGGRIVGEGCHFIDFVQFMTGALPVRVSATAVRSGNDRETDSDSVAITLGMSDGSIGTILYVALGDKRFPKERCEIYADGSVGVLDDFKSGFLVRNGREEALRGGAQDKGHDAEVAAFIEAVRTGAPAPIALESLVATTLASFAVLDALRTGGTIDLTEELRSYGLII